RARGQDHLGAGGPARHRLPGSLRDAAGYRSHQAGRVRRLHRLCDAERGGRRVRGRAARRRDAAPARALGASKRSAPPLTPCRRATVIWGAMQRLFRACFGALVLMLGWPATARAQAPRSQADTPAPDEPPPHDVRTEVPIVGFAYTAHGASGRTVGAEAYGLGLVAKNQPFIAGGGVTVWGSPIERLTLVGDAARDQFGNFAPS